MRTILKNLFITLLVILLTVPSVTASFAEGERGGITITLEDKEKNRLDDIKVHLCRIADLSDSGYVLAPAFKDSGISISGIVNNETVAKTIVDYVKEKNIETLLNVSINGIASFSDLDLGIWLVYCEESSPHTFNPYVVFLPYESGNELHFEVASAPKVDDNTPNEISIYVIKKWDDKNNASKKRPDSVTIELMNKEDVVGSVVLSEENGWAHTFLRLPKDGVYSVRERAISNYKVDYSGDAANGFVITNTYAGEKLPQTGQFWWPIAVIALAGVCFVLLGIFELGAKKNGKKK